MAIREYPIVISKWHSRCHKRPEFGPPLIGKEGQRKQRMIHRDTFAIFLVFTKRRTDVQQRKC